MKSFQIIVDFFTSFLITAGGAMGIAFLVAKGQPLSQEVWLSIVALGLVQAAKGTRNLIGLPPLSNGNYAAISELMKSKASSDTQQFAKPPQQKA